MQTIIDEWMDKGLQKGLRQGLQQGLEQGQQLGQQLGQQQGQQQGAVAVAVRLLHKRCGELGPEVKQRVKDLSFAQLEDMSEALFDFQTVADLKAWLDAHETTH